MKTLKDLIEILALPNMGDEGRKQKLIAIKAWQIEFERDLTKAVQEIEVQSNDVGYRTTMLRFHTVLMKILFGENYLEKKKGD